MMHVFSVSQYVQVHSTHKFSWMSSITSNQTQQDAWAAVLPLLHVARLVGLAIAERTKAINMAVKLSGILLGDCSNTFEIPKPCYTP
jgi:hypothetical protein